MSVSFARGIGAASVLAISAAAGWADVTAQDVWSDWKSYLSGMGYEITANENASGGVLSVSDVVMNMPMPEENGQAQITMGEITFSENGDGTVDVKLPAEMPVTFSADVEDGEKVDVELIIGQSNPGMTVSGDPDDMTSVYGADSMTMTLKSLMVDGEAIPASVANFTLTMNDVGTNTRSVLSDKRQYTQDMTVETVSYALGFDDPESEDQASISGNLSKVGFNGTAAIPLQVDSTDMRKMLDAGFEFDGTFNYGGGNSSMSGTGEGETFGYESQSEGGSLKVAMNATQLVYDVLQTGATVTISSGEIPFPVMVSMAEAGFKLAMPVAQSDEDQEFAFGIRLGDFSMPETLWGIFDPAAILPRDPATIAIDMTGKAKVLFDILDPEAAVAMGDQPPGSLEALTINELLVSAVGAKLSGTGDFTFDNSDLSSFDGMPAPTGTANLQLNGANALIDKLIQMGIVGEEEAMGARMMMSMFAVPGEGDDALKSQIDFTEEGHILANGQRIK
ncbi:MAG: DUF2125 domain-containing protein [Rhodobacteraceae bacterium]|nr:DUF2125 domain-containing protein [Paracoccaceae bacterium]